MPRDLFCTFPAIMWEILSDLGGGSAVCLAFQAIIAMYLFPGHRAFSSDPEPTLSTSATCPVFKKDTHWPWKEKPFERR